MKILKSIPVQGPFTMVWTENGRTVSTDLIANGERINLARMPELGDLRQDVVDNMPADAIIIVAEDKVLVEVDKMPESGQFVAFWDYKDQRWHEDWKIENGVIYMGTDEWDRIEWSAYEDLNLRFGVWQ
ncbi:hypothetical protein UGMREWDR_CDS0158 [Aeromonas phage GomatiRiver_11]|nr:hypothetical protein OBDJBBDK_00150 [Aeromonas phage AhFM11]WKW84325.1 hypothetical protein UGMREWDR_CDS0158 [Aeromonas phage GomatiRiver_11]